MSKGSKPVYLAKARQAPDHNGKESDFMHVLGAAFAFKEGDGLVVKLTTIPVGWDGGLILVKPKNDEE